MRLGVAATAAVALLSSGCGLGQTLPATRVTDVGATLTGKVRNTGEGLTRYRFEYGPTDSYGSTTPWRETEIEGGAAPVTEVVGGLPHGALRHFRLCAADADGRGACGADRTFTTTGGEDSVVGEGVLVDNGDFSYQAAVDAHSGPSGAAPRGSGRARPGSSTPRTFDTGSVVCLRVDGDRATVGIDVVPLIGGEPHTGRLIFVKDNGPTGDYLSHSSADAPPTSCPPATDDRFIAAPPGSDPPFAALVSGDFQVHDHPDSSPTAR